jgi:hypothetical protein
MSGLILALSFLCHSSAPVPPEAARAVGMLEDGRRRRLPAGEYELSESEVNAAVAYYAAKDKEAKGRGFLQVRKARIGPTPSR